MVANCSRHFDLVPVGDRPTLEQHLAHTVALRVGSQPRSIAIEQDDFMLGVDREQRMQQLARVDLHATIVLIEMPQHDPNAHVFIRSC